jgi:hypothetical protein
VIDYGQTPVTIRFILRPLLTTKRTHSNAQKVAIAFETTAIAQNPKTSSETRFRRSQGERAWCCLGHFRSCSNQRHYPYPRCPFRWYSSCGLLWSSRNQRYRFRSAPRNRHCQYFAKLHKVERHGQGILPDSSTKLSRSSRQVDQVLSSSTRPRTLPLVLSKSLLPESLRLSQDHSALA